MSSATPGYFSYADRGNTKGRSRMFIQEPINEEKQSDSPSLDRKRLSEDLLEVT